MVCLLFELRTLSTVASASGDTIRERQETRHNRYAQEHFLPRAIFLFSQSLLSFFYLLAISHRYYKYEREKTCTPSQFAATLPFLPRLQPASVQFTQRAGVFALMMT
ncbi:hypothetical protein E2C01_000450 [Portunus trituberculatus]|uniref:Uncharacterized protein n=1 Tax=Portunus trituberculatus TaxID=210409 RepID=A0A5B7CF74_PORTR|nr:hypothetical protein [Portunus trituberculatus]